MVGVTKGFDVQAGAGQEPVEEAGPVLHPFQAGFHQGSQLGQVAFGQVGQGPFQVGPDQFDRVEFMGIRRELADGQPVPGPRSAQSSRR